VSELNEYISILQQEKDRASSDCEIFQQGMNSANKELTEAKKEIKEFENENYKLQKYIDELEIASDQKKLQQI